METTESETGLRVFSGLSLSPDSSVHSPPKSHPSDEIPPSTSEDKTADELMKADDNYGLCLQHDPSHAVRMSKKFVEHLADRFPCVSGSLGSITIYRPSSKQLEEIPVVDGRGL
jgi:hypothetical protein